MLRNPIIIFSNVVINVFLYYSIKYHYQDMGPINTIILNYNEGKQYFGISATVM